MKFIDFILGRKSKQEVVDEALETDPLDERFLESMSVEPDYNFRMTAEFEGGPLAKQTRYVSGGQSTIFVPFTPKGESYSDVGVPLLDNGKAIAVYTKRFVGVYYWDGNITLQTLMILMKTLGDEKVERRQRSIYASFKEEQKEQEDANVG